MGVKFDRFRIFVFALPWASMKVLSNAVAFCLEETFTVLKKPWKWLLDDKTVIKNKDWHDWMVLYFKGKAFCFVICCDTWGRARSGVLCRCRSLIDKTSSSRHWSPTSSSSEGPLKNNIKIYVKILFFIFVSYRWILNLKIFLRIGPKIKKKWWSKNLCKNLPRYWCLGSLGHRIRRACFRLLSRVRYFGHLVVQLPYF